jgi:hypothetical protein
MPLPGQRPSGRFPERRFHREARLRPGLPPPEALQHSHQLQRLAEDECQVAGEHGVDPFAEDAVLPMPGKLCGFTRCQRLQRCIVSKNGRGQMLAAVFKERAQYRAQRLTRPLLLTDPARIERLGTAGPLGYPLTSARITATCNEGGARKTSVSQ